jgi:hypothetical protein
MLAGLCHGKLGLNEIFHRVCEIVPSEKEYRPCAMTDLREIRLWAPAIVAIE